MSSKLKFYYDVASPYSYLAFARIQDVAKASGVSVLHRPFLIGGVFRSTNNQMPSSNPARGRYMLKDLDRWSEAYSIPFKFSSSFPHNSLVAMRTIIAAPEADRIRLSAKIFSAAWVSDQDIGNMDVLREILGDDAIYLTHANAQEVKDELRQITDEAVAAGAFGAPFFLVGNEEFWGNDRLEMAIEYATSA